MTKLKRTTLAVAALGLMAGASVVEAVPFSVTSAAFDPQNGYGKDRCEYCGSLLDVRFDTAAFTPQSFSLDSIGASRTFNIGTLNFQEPETGGGISGSETDHLGVKASLTFANPDGTPSIVKLQGTGTAYTGAIADSAVDYKLTWKSELIHFGTRGLFEISFADLAFTNIGALTQTATITLKQSDAVPEPGSMALFGLGLAGLGLIRRKRAS